MSVILPVRREPSEASSAPSPVNVPDFDASPTWLEWMSSTSSSNATTSRKLSVMWRRMTMSPWCEGVAS